MKTQLSITSPGVPYREIGSALACRGRLQGSFYGRKAGSEGLMGVKVREKPKGSGEWWIFIDHEGKRKSKKVGIDEKIAQDVAEKIKAKLVLGEISMETLQPQCPTFKEYAETWLSLPHDWKASTRESYDNNFRLHIYPAFGRQRLDQIRRRDLKVFFDKLLVSGLSPSTAGLIRCPISGVFSHAVDSELIESNPLNDLKLRYKKRRINIYPLTDEETALVLDQAKEYLHGLYYPHLLCAFRTGLRIGELQALQWGDIDFKGGFIEVAHSFRKKRLTDTKNRLHRRVDMTPHLAENLKDLKLSQKKWAFKAGRQAPDWVFANKKGDILCREAFGRALRKCLEKSELRTIRTHDTRHTYATIRLLRGHNIGDVSYQLGHSSISITYDVYGHWIPGKFKNEVNELDQPHLSAPYTQPENKPVEN